MTEPPTSLPPIPPSVHVQEVSGNPLKISVEESLKNIPGGEILVKNVEAVAQSVIKEPNADQIAKSSSKDIKAFAGSDRVRSLVTLYPALRTTYQPGLDKSRITNEEVIKNCVDLTTREDQENVSSNVNNRVILVRGCSQATLIAIATGQSRDGEPMDPGVGRPSEEESIAQVGESGHLPEYTTKQGIAEDFAKGKFFVMVEIDASYLRKASGAEGGWVIDPKAPVTLVGWKEGQPLIDIKKAVLPTSSRSRPILKEAPMGARTRHIPISRAPPLPKSQPPPLDEPEPPPLPASPVPPLKPH